MLRGLGFIELFLEFHKSLRFFDFDGFQNTRLKGPVAPCGTLWQLVAGCGHNIFPCIENSLLGSRNRSLEALRLDPWRLGSCLACK